MVQTGEGVSMNIQIELSEQLSKAIYANYEKANYTGAILDSIFLMSDVLRDRTGCQSDGVPLVGEALSGSAPKLRLTPLRNESDRNIQKQKVFDALATPRSGPAIRPLIALRKDAKIQQHGNCKAPALARGN